jgi:hypothetical protein
MRGVAGSSRGTRIVALGRKEHLSLESHEISAIRTAKAENKEGKSSASTKTDEICRLVNTSRRYSGDVERGVSSRAKSRDNSMPHQENEGKALQLEWR